MRGGGVEARPGAAGYCFEWSDILRDLDRLIEGELEQDEKKITLYTAADGTCTKVFEAVDVPLPQYPECIGVLAPQSSPASSPME